jgi:hypothetical protein
MRRYAVGDKRFGSSPTGNPISGYWKALLGEIDETRR